MKIRFLVLMLLSLLQFACNQDEEVKSSHYHLSETIEGEKSVNKSFIGKPHAPIDMSYEYLNQPVLDEELELSLTFRLQRETQLLKIAFRSSEGVVLLDGVQPQLFSNLEKGAEVRISLRVKPSTTELAYVNVFAMTTLQDKKQSRSFAVPVQAVLSKDPSNLPLSIQSSQPSSQEPSARTQYQPEHNVVSMPAVESTSVPRTEPVSDE